MKNEQIPSVDSFPKMGEKMFSNMIQIRLAQICYEVRYGEKPDMSDPEIRNTVGLEWATLYAESFGNYLKKNPQETLDIADEDALYRLFEKLTSEEDGE